MYKLLCTDMDGTLLNSKGEISKENIRAIKLAHEKGVKVTICTGRVFTSARYFADLLGIRVPVIASNGAYIREKDKNDVIYKSVLGEENCNRILGILKKYELSPHFHTTNIIFIETITGSSRNYTNFNSKVPKDKQINIQIIKDWERVFKDHKDDLVKCVCVDDNKEKILAAKQELRELSELEVVSSAENNFEVMCKGVSKGRAVEILAAYYDIKREEIMCIGDNENDMSMIQYAGMGVAMGNGEQFVKSAADFITDTNDNQGVAKAIEKFILM